jgi:hypothetical protein
VHFLRKYGTSAVMRTGDIGPFSVAGFAAGRPAAVLVDSEGHIHFAPLKTLENLNSFCRAEMNPLR